MADTLAPPNRPPVERITSTTSLATSPTSADYIYPRGHLGHLSEREERALEEFKVLLKTRGIYLEGPPVSHDDALLLRFLRARRWVPADAFKQLKDTEDWRLANDINVLYNTIDLNAYQQCWGLYPQWTGRRDRRGIPVYIYKVVELDSKTVSKYDKAGSRNTTFSDAKTDGKTPSNLLRLFALYENLTRFMMPFASQLKDREFPDVPISMSTNVVDISGVGLKQFWNLKNHMQAASVLATAHYPETLDRIFVIGAPPFFNTVWGWIKRWFDPITVSKIFILNPNDVYKTLESYIERSNIPTQYGGDLPFKFGDGPVADPNWEGVVAWEDGHTNFPGGPLVWEDIDGGQRMACYGLGKRDGVQRKELVCTIRTFQPMESAVVPEKTNGAALAAAPEPVPAPAPVTA